MRKLVSLIAAMLSVLMGFSLHASSEPPQDKPSSRASHQRYRILRSPNSDEVMIEPVNDRATVPRATVPKYRVSCPDGEEDEDCGCRGTSKGARFGR